ncbi:hypothetical protein BASA81_014115 [Batrachochytrium salamandrivorans]|nr:hypothetical protein BASA81_014115 [Batrachochytrium salamandrivorans]
MFDTLLWVLHHFVIYYSGQTTQGDTNDDVDQASGSKDATSLPLGVDNLKLPRVPWRTKASSKNGASAPADPQSEEECKGGHGIRKLFRSCTQQQSPTPYVPDQSDEMPLPTYVKREKLKS